MKSVAIRACLLLIVVVACGTVFGADSIVLVRVERQAADDLEVLKSADLPVVAEMDSCLFLEAAPADIAWLQDHGYETSVLDGDASRWDYLVVGVRPDSDLAALESVGAVLLSENNWKLVRVPPKTSFEALDRARVFVARLSHEPVAAPKKQPSLTPSPAEAAAVPLAADPLVQQMVNSVSTTQVDQFWTDLTVNSPTGTRYSSSQGCADAGTYCYNKYTGYGLTAQYQNWSVTYKPNIIGTQDGAITPGNVYIVIGHMDDLPSTGAAPGADDNASGTIVALESAQVMSCYAFRNTVKYINCTGEEQGLLGSDAYAADAQSRGENILGVINMDMPGWAGDGIPNPENLDLNYNAASQDLAQRFAQASTTYGTGLAVDAFLCPSLNASDHYPFWTRGWKAVCGITDNEGYCSHAGSYPYYHTSNDTIANCGNKSFYYSVVRTSVAALAELAQPFKVALDKSSYGCGSSAQVYVGDRDLNTNPSVIEAATVNAYSTTEPTPETFTVTEKNANSMIFIGTVPTTTGPPVHGDGLLSVAVGDTITVGYTDALDCNGATNVAYTTTAQIVPCTPSFGGLTSVTNPGVSTCTLNLAWTAAASTCGGAVSYNVYRSTTSGFTPGADNLIASGVTGTSYTDAVGISYPTTYYYIVRAQDSLNNIEETNTVQKSGAPTGPVSTSSWADTFEGSQSGGGFDQPGWTHNYITGTTNWVWSTARTHDGTHSWFAQDVGSASDKVLVSPVFGVLSNTTLSFWHTYAFESTSTCYDGGTLEYTTNGGTTWTVVPVGDFTTGGYNGTVYSGSSNPIAGKRAWCGGTIGAMTQVSVNLGGDANLLNKTVQVRWHEGDDVNTYVTGWYVDTVTVNNAGVATSCTTGAGCTAPGPPTLTGATGDCAGVNLAWTAGSGTTNSYNVYRATATGGPYAKLSGMPVTGTSYSDATAVSGTTYFYVVKGACDAGGANESAFSAELFAARWTSGTACNDGNACTQTDTCQSGACVGSNPVVCTASDQCHSVGTCNTSTGVCSNPAKPNGTVCNDGDLCTQSDTCQSGACVGSNPVACTAQDQCHDAGACNPATGACSNPAKPNGTACDDGNACTQSDACQAGACAGSNPVTCSAQDQCHDAGTCNPLNGQCSNPEKPSGTACDDANPCTTGDSCLSGACGGGALVPPPPEAGDTLMVALTTPTSARVAWTLPFSATSSDLLRGLVSALPVGPAGGDEACIGPGVMGTTLPDNDLPPAGDSFWYVVRGASVCGKGPYGFRVDTSGPPTERVSTTCP